MILLLRGTPGAGKSTVGPILVGLLGGGPLAALVEVDELRSDLWYTEGVELPDGAHYRVALSHAARVALALLGAGVGRVVVADTFAPWAVAAFEAALRGRASTSSVSLVVDEPELGRRLATRPEIRGVFRDFAAAAHLNAELGAEPGAIRLDTSRVAPRVIAERVARAWLPPHALCSTR